MAFVKNQLVRVSLVSDPAYWIDIEKQITWATMKKLSEVDEQGKSSYQVDAMLLTLIKAWNLDDEKGDILPITSESIDLLPREDIEKLVQQIGGKLEDSKSEKKDS